MSVAASSPSTALTPTLPPLALKASRSLDLALLARVFAFSASFFSPILAMAAHSRAAAGGWAASVGSGHGRLNEGYYWFDAAAFAQLFPNRLT
jgi:hypothetical protein